MDTVQVELPNTIEECHRVIGELVALIALMQGKLDDLTARLNQHSQNSSRPPARDDFPRPHPQPAFPRPKKPRGGQTGHTGQTLQRVPDPDVIVECPPQECLCGATQWVGDAAASEERQVFDLPAPRLEVTAYRRLTQTCQCERASSGEFPAEVKAPAQYGGGLQGLVALLSVQGCLSHAKIGQLCADLYGYEVNEATVQEMLQRTAAAVPLEDIKAGLLAAPAVHFDETGVRVGGQTYWLHNASNENLTYQYVHEKRGTAALRDEKSVLPEFRGIGVHDCWAGYFGFGEMTHALCNAHILRELTGIIENQESQWGAAMKELLLEMYVASDYGKGVIEERGGYEQRYEEILAAGEAEEPLPQRVHAKGKPKATKGRNLLVRLRKQQEAVLRFSEVEEVPFTNNQAERDIRPTKVKQKVSGGFRAVSGAENYSRINSFVSSMRKLKRRVFEEVHGVIRGKPCAPV